MEAEDIEGPGKFRVVLGPKRAEKQERAHQFRREMTPAEVRLWQHLRANRLDGLHFRRQQVIDGFIADFYCHAAGLVIELDGAAHEGRRGYDAERDKVIEARGLLVLRFPNGRVETDLKAVLVEILLTARRRIKDAAP